MCSLWVCLATVGARIYTALLRIYRALLQMAHLRIYRTLLQMHCALFTFGCTLQQWKLGYKGFFGRYTQLICRYVGFFCGYIGLFWPLSVPRNDGSSKNCMEARIHTILRTAIVSRYTQRPKEPYISAKEPYISTNELCVSAKKPHVLLCATILRMHSCAIYPQKSQWYPQKSTIYPQKSPVYPQNSPAYLNSQQTLVFLTRIVCIRAVGYGSIAGNFPVCTLRRWELR